MSQSDDILRKTYDFILYLIPQLNKFPRHQKFLLADRIENMILDILENYITAYYSKAENKRIVLVENNLKLEKMRFLIRLSHDMHFFSHQKYGVISGFIDEIGKMTGGWIKSLNK